MHILHLITSTRSFFEQQIAVLEDKGVTCTVIDVPGDYRAASPRSPADYARYYPRILEAVRRESFDLVHAHYGLVSPFAIAQPCRPLVLSLWGTDLMSEMAWLRGLSRVGARFADATVLPSRAMADHLGREYVYIPFGVDIERFRPIPRAAARSRIGWTTNRPVVLFPYDPDRQVKDYPLAERVMTRIEADVELRVVDAVPHDEMPYYMNASDVLLVTSRRESGPMTVKEAAACNLPVVSTDVGFVRDTVGDMRNCVVADNVDTLARAVDRVIADGRRTNARSHVETLGLDEMGDRLIALYRRLLDRPVAEPLTMGWEGDARGI